MDKPKLREMQEALAEALEYQREMLEKAAVDQLVYGFGQPVGGPQEAQSEAIDDSRYAGSGPFHIDPDTYEQWRARAIKGRSLSIDKGVATIHGNGPVQVKMYGGGGGIGGDGRFVVDEFLPRFETDGGRAQKNTECDHEPIDVGFTHSRIVCKKCDKDLK